MAIEASQEFVNKYVERQQRAIADLMNKVVLLETQLAMATDRIKALEVNQREETADGDFAPSEIKAE
jgi:predicted  nucleic acid-binding Zn-ribbon protein